MDSFPPHCSIFISKSMGRLRVGLFSKENAFTSKEPLTGSCRKLTKALKSSLSLEKMTPPFIMRYAAVMMTANTAPEFCALERYRNQGGVDTNVR